MPNEPVKFTDEVREKYLELIRNGETKSHAATLVGMNRDSIQEYCQRHRDFAGKVRNADPHYFSPEKRKRYLALLLQGQTRSGAAQMVGVPIYQVLKYEREHPKVAETFRWARETAVQVVVDSLYSKAVEGDVNAANKWLINATKNADESKGETKWISESTKMEVTGKNNGPIDVQLSPSERQERINQLLVEHLQLTSGSDLLPKLDCLLNEKSMPNDFLNSADDHKSIDRRTRQNQQNDKEDDEES